MTLKKVWYAVLGILPVYGAYNTANRIGGYCCDVWDGLLAGIILAVILFVVGEGAFFVVRKIQRRC